MPQEGSSSVFSLFSLIKLHLASLPLASSYSRVAVSSVFCAQNIFFSAQTRGAPLSIYLMSQNLRLDSQSFRCVLYVTCKTVESSHDKPAVDSSCYFIQKQNAVILEFLVHVDCTSKTHTRKRRILRSDTHWPSRRVVGILIRARDGPRPPA